jgi:chaperone modulatory protein CbpM
METREFLFRTRLDLEALASCMAAGWLVPRRTGEMLDFSEVDVARASLILDLRDIGINDEAIPVVLDLIDQIHGLRRVLRELLLVVRAPSDADPASEDLDARRDQAPAEEQTRVRPPH